MWQVLFDAKYSTLWTAVCAIATGCATVLGVLALIYTVSGFRKSLKTSQYISLDGMYLTILQLTLERPYLKTPALLATDTQRAEYDSYAYMLWNFMETIYDHCQRDAELRGTWYPTIQAETEVHWGWLEVPENRRKFKEPFHSFIAERGYETA